MEYLIEKTRDGSHTLYIPDLNERFHSIHGAITESNHVFIKAGMEYINKKEINLFEVGFGAGLNTLLTFLYATQKKFRVNYKTIDLYPLDKEIIKKLNFSDLLGISNSTFLSFHYLQWDVPHRLNNSFIFHKIKGDILTSILTGKFDLIYFDAFGPEIQPELWEENIFEKMFSILKTNGVLTTYSAKGKVKRALKKVGFFVECIPGPPGKREMTRAIKLQ